MQKQQEILSIKNIYKVFGNHPEKAMKMLEEGETKDKIFYQTGQTVGVLDASFSVNRGEIFVIMGLSGSGKSTMVRLLNRLIEPTAGSITLNGTDITNLNDQELLQIRRKEMSMVFQSFALMPHMSVIDNAAFGLDISGIDKSESNRRAQEALDQVGLSGHSGSFPHQLSGGMQQRVGLARALANDPTILLMDEAFSALDPLIRHEMQGELIRLQKEQQRTIIFISHDLDEAIRIGDRIAIMEGGRVVQTGTPQELMQNPVDDYVETFFKGVDVTKILKAKDIASCDGLDVQSALSPLDLQTNSEQEFIYFVNEQEQLQAVVARQDVKLDTHAVAILDTYDTLHQIDPDMPLKSIIKTVNDSPYPVPVINKNGSLSGVISKDVLLQTLSQYSDTSVSNSSTIG
jgi:glycine betaine/proline transport system ATP-binding protein